MDVSLAQEIVIDNMTYPQEIQKLLDQGKLKEGYCIGVERYVHAIDYPLLEATKGTHVATSEGHGILVMNPDEDPEGKLEYHLVDFAHNHSPYSKIDLDPGYAHRVSVLLYDDHVELMNRMADEFREFRHNSPSNYLSTQTYKIIGKRSFMTLEAIMAAQSKGMYADKSIFRNLNPYEPLANPKYKKVLWNNLPKLWGEDRRFLLEKNRTFDPFGTKASFDTILSELEINPLEFLDALQFIDDCQFVKGSVIGGCYICEHDCH